MVRKAKLFGREAACCDNGPFWRSSRCFTCSKHPAPRPPACSGGVSQEAASVYAIIVPGLPGANLINEPILYRQDEHQDFQDAELAELELACSISGEPHLFRLFVGWVPKLFSESDLRPLFDQVRGAGAYIAGDAASLLAGGDAPRRYASVTSCNDASCVKIRSRSFVARPGSHTSSAATRRAGRPAARARSNRPALDH
jgi:hypothetical protein